jgi:hypothetical protein
VRQVQRDGDVAQPAVHADDAVRGAHAVGQRIEAHRRPHLGGGRQRGRDAPGALVLRATGLRQRDAPALSHHAPPQLDPVRLGPELVVARGAVDEHHGALGRVQRVRAQAEHGRPLHGVAEHAGGEHARAVQRMDARLDFDRVVHEPAGRPFVARAFGLVGQAVARPARQARDERRLGEALEVDDRVVALAADGVAKEPPLLAHGTRPPARAPAPQRALDAAVDALHAPHEGREPRLDDPVDERVGMGGADVVHDRHRVHHVTQGGQLDDQDPHEVSGPPRRRVRRASPRAAPP